MSLLSKKFREYKLSQEIIDRDLCITLGRWKKE